MGRVRSAIVILSVLLAGCGGMLHRYSGSVGIAVMTKRVADKRDPDLLIAYDRSTCTVSKERFREIRINDPVRCAWRTPADAPHGIVAGDGNGAPAVPTRAPVGGLTDLVRSAAPVRRPAAGPGPAPSPR